MQIFLLLLTMIFDVSPHALAIQEPVQVGENELARRNFPWYEAESGTVVDLERTPPKQAKSINRADIPLREKKQRTAKAPPNPGWATAFSYLMWSMIALAGIAIAAFIVWVFLKMESRDGSTADSYLDEEEKIQQRITQLPFQLDDQRKGDFRTMANAAAHSGDYGKATMLLFSHVLLTLDKKNLIQLKRGKTNRQYLNELIRHQSLKRFYEKIMVPFEDNFFGDYDIAKSVFEECWSDLDSFHSNVAKSSELFEVDAV